MPEDTDLDLVVSSITTTFGGITEHIPTVVAAAIGVALLFWGVRKLVGLFKSVAK